MWHITRVLQFKTTLLSCPNSYMSDAHSDKESSKQSTSRRSLWTPDGNQGHCLGKQAPVFCQVPRSQYPSDMKMFFSYWAFFKKSLSTRLQIIVNLNREKFSTVPRFLVFNVHQTVLLTLNVSRIDGSGGITSPDNSVRNCRQYMPSNQLKIFNSLTNCSLQCWFGTLKVSLNSLGW